MQHLSHFQFQTRIPTSKLQCDQWFSVFPTNLLVHDSKLPVSVLQPPECFINDCCATTCFSTKYTSSVDLAANTWLAKSNQILSSLNVTSKKSHSLATFAKSAWYKKWNREKEKESSDCAKSSKYSSMQNNTKSSQFSNTIEKLDLPIFTRALAIVCTESNGILSNTSYSGLPSKNPSTVSIWIRVVWYWTNNEVVFDGK